MFLEISQNSQENTCARVSRDADAEISKSASAFGNLGIGSASATLELKVLYIFVKHVIVNKVAIYRLGICHFVGKCF